MNSFNQDEKKSDEIKTEQNNESEVGQATGTTETQSIESDSESKIKELQYKVEDVKEEKSLPLRKSLHQMEENKELEKKDSEVIEQYGNVEEKVTKLKPNHCKENEERNNEIEEVEQKFNKIQVYTPPRPTSEKKVHLVALVKRVAKNKYKFVRVQHRNLRDSLQKFAKEREMEYKEFLESDYVKIWEDCPHAVDTADNTIKFLSENKYQAGNLEVTWTESRRKLERIVEVFLYKGAGGKKAAEEILQMDDAFTMERPSGGNSKN